MRIPFLFGILAVLLISAVCSFSETPENQRKVTKEQINAFKVYTHQTLGIEGFWTELDLKESDFGLGVFARSDTPTRFEFHCDNALYMGGKHVPVPEVFQNRSISVQFYAAFLDVRFFAGAEIHKPLWDVTPLEFPFMRYRKRFDEITVYKETSYPPSFSIQTKMTELFLRNSWNEFSKELDEMVEEGIEHPILTQYVEDKDELKNMCIWIQGFKYAYAHSRPNITTEEERVAFYPLLMNFNSVHDEGALPFGDTYDEVKSNEHGCNFGMSQDVWNPIKGKEVYTDYFGGMEEGEHCYSSLLLHYGFIPFQNEGEEFVHQCLSFNVHLPRTETMKSRIEFLRSWIFARSGYSVISMHTEGSSVVTLSFHGYMNLMTLGHIEDVVSGIAIGFLSDEEYEAQFETLRYTGDVIAQPQVYLHVINLIDTLISDEIKHIETSIIPDIESVSESAYEVDAFIHIAKADIHSRHILRGLLKEIREHVENVSGESLLEGSTIEDLDIGTSQVETNLENGFYKDSERMCVHGICSCPPIEIESDETKKDYISLDQFKESEFNCGSLLQN
eukprot:TRINITY_DN146966_c0_g1_i2.p1 TRINITY_DN146966_c0_g1~~TRINITY_DN146966_c0_g1_i2.p1  ORF type:complete len:561 (-),score=128.15 TRINITY_DN146966_c0_g1_i2:352-2034(-)